MGVIPLGGCSCVNVFKLKFQRLVRKNESVSFVITHCPVVFVVRMDTMQNPCINNYSDKIDATNGDEVQKRATMVTLEEEIQEAILMIHLSLPNLFGCLLDGGQQSRSRRGGEFGVRMDIHLNQNHWQ